jgi:hypothetical protein
MWLIYSQPWSGTLTQRHALFNRNSNPKSRIVVAPAKPLARPDDPPPRLTEPVAGPIAKL